MIQHKLAEMAIRIYAAESMTYRVDGLIESHLEGFTWDEPDAAKTHDEGRRRVRRRVLHH